MALFSWVYCCIERVLVVADGVGAGGYSAVCVFGTGCLGGEAWVVALVKVRCLLIPLTSYFLLTHVIDACRCGFGARMDQTNLTFFRW